jgi:hypothetical protein
VTARADRRIAIAGCHFDLRLDKRLPPGRVKKFLLNLGRNVLQPFLGTISPILIVSDIHLEIIYLVVGSSKLIVSGSKLIREFLSDLPCFLEVCCSRISSTANQPKNCIPCPVDYFGFRTLFRGIRNNGLRICNLIHRNPRTSTACLRYSSIHIRAPAI